MAILDDKIVHFKVPFHQGDRITADQAMQLAIEVAYFGAPYVSPNPLVGCVVVDSEHRFLDFGYHKRYGFDHAEADALKKL